MPVKMGYNVVHYTLELGEDYVGRRYDAFFTGKPVDTLYKNRDKVEETVKELPGQLIIKEYAPGQATVNTIRGSHTKM